MKLNFKSMLDKKRYIGLLIIDDFIVKTIFSFSKLKLSFRSLPAPSSFCQFKFSSDYLSHCKVSSERAHILLLTFSPAPKREPGT